MDLTSIAIFNKHREPAAVIQVGMREDHGVQRAQIDRRHAAVVLFGKLLALVHPHIDHHAGSLSLNDVARARNLAGCSKESKLDHRESSAPHYEYDSVARSSSRRAAHDGLRRRLRFLPRPG